MQGEPMLSKILAAVDDTERGEKRTYNTNSLAKVNTILNKL
jgi:hypothetical protein